MSFGKTVLTKRALQLNAGFIDSTARVKITGVRGGKADTGTEEVRLVDECMEFDVIGEIVQEQNRLKVQLYYDNKDVVAGFDLAELGIYVQDDQADEGESLYAIAKAVPPLPIAPLSQGRIEVLCTLVVELSANAQVTMLVDSSVYLTKTEAVATYSPLDHKHIAGEIVESVGKTTEDVQREQDDRLTLLERATGNMIVVRNLFNAQVWTITRGVLIDKTLTSGGNA